MEYHHKLDNSIDLWGNMLDSNFWPLEGAPGANTYVMLAQVLDNLVVGREDLSTETLRYLEIVKKMVAAIKTAKKNYPYGKINIEPHGYWPWSHWAVSARIISKTFKTAKQDYIESLGRFLAVEYQERLSWSEDGKLLLEAIISG